LFPPEKQYNYIGKLSGGEKKRLQLLKLLVTNPNFLILDEPTNDFDIDTLNVLEDFLEKFSGCLLLVSHDRYFMDHLVDQLFVFEGDGNIRLFNGNYTDYRDWQDEQESMGVKKNTETVSQDKSEIKTETTPQKRKASYKEKQEYESLQSEIEILEGKKAELTLLMESGETDHVKLQKWSEDLRKMSEQIDEKTARWLALAEFIE
jgi:ABC transport system ATP-binding/permease protein